MTDTWTIAIEGLVLRYRGASSPAVSGVDLFVEGGGIAAIIGETGSGKSTLVRAALGLLADGATAEGRIQLRTSSSGVVNPLELEPGPAAAFRRRFIGYVPQLTQRALVPVLSVREHFRQFASKAEPASGGDIDARAVYAMETIGLQDARRILGMYPHQLSGGMAQRVCIALAMFGSAPIVVADEPTSGLDALVRRRVAELLQEELAAAGRTMLLVTHDLALARRIATDVTVLYRGRVMESTPAAEFFERPRHTYSRHLLASLPQPGRELPPPFDPTTFDEEAVS